MTHNFFLSLIKVNESKKVEYDIFNVMYNYNNRVKFTLHVRCVSSKLQCNSSVLENTQ